MTVSEVDRPRVPVLLERVRYSPETPKSCPSPI